MNDITPPGFDALFRHNEDPWGFRTRWYEARKRAMTLACLPQARYASGFEPGCANGELTAQLAGRCERLLASDVSPRAVELARTRLAALPHVEVVQALLPDQWPRGRFDLVVISELGYFVDGPSLDAMAAHTLAYLLPAATVLACHWRRPIQGCAMDGDAVHARLAQGLQLPQLCEVREADFVLNVWSSDPKSVAQREGFDW